MSSGMHYGGARTYNHSSCFLSLSLNVDELVTHAALDRKYRKVNTNGSQLVRLEFEVLHVDGRRIKQLVKSTIYELE